MGPGRGAWWWRWRVKGQWTRCAPAAIVHPPGSIGHQGTPLAPADSRSRDQHGAKWLQYFQDDKCLTALDDHLFYSLGPLWYIHAKGVYQHCAVSQFQLLIKSLMLTITWFAACGTEGIDWYPPVGSRSADQQNVEWAFFFFQAKCGLHWCMSNQPCQLSLMMMMMMMIHRICIAPCICETHARSCDQHGKEQIKCVFKATRSWQAPLRHAN